jgi:hypothetical protein
MMTACVETPPGDIPQLMSAGEKLFGDYIMPLLEQRCASCHADPSDSYMAPDYLGTSKSMYYDMLVKNVAMVSCDVENSILLVKGFDKNHPGGDLSSDEREKVTTWLSTEALDRFGGRCEGSTSVPTALPQLTGQEAMKQFGDCMTLEDWKATGMHLVANQLCTYLGNGNNQCKGCHSEGQGSNWMSYPDDVQGVDQEAVLAEYFEKMRYPYASFNLIRWRPNLTDGSFEDIVQSNRWRDKGKDGGNHATYELSPENAAAIDAWFQTTYDRWKSGLCTPMP